MGKLSGSKMDLARKCLHPFTSEAKWPKRTSDSSANLGLAFHRVVELHLSGEEGSIAAIAAEFGLDENDAIVLARMFDGFLEDPAADPSGVLAEQAYVFDARTGEVRHLGRIRGREYGHLERWEIACTVDAVIDHGDGTGAIVDWKTGRQRHLVPARDNRQVAFGSMCAAKAHGWTRVKGRLSLIDEDGSVRTAERDLDEYAIDGVEAEVRRIVEEIQLAPEPAPGLHCALLRCPYVTECRESTSALAEIAGDTLVPIDLPASVRYPLTGEIENEDQAIFFMHRLAAAKKVLQAMEKRIEDFSDEVGGLSLGGGAYFGGYPVEYDTPDLANLTPDGEALLRELGVREASKLTLTKAAIENVVREDSGLKGVKLKAEVERIVARLRSASMTKHTAYPRYEIRNYAPPPKLEAEEGGEG